MEQIVNYIGNPWLATAFIILGGILALVLRSFLSKYVSVRAQHIAEGINLPEQLTRTFADQAVRSSAARLDVSRAEAAMKIIGLMSQIEALILNWKITAFFHSDELMENQTVEDLGIRDLKKAAQFTMELIKETNGGSVLLGDQALTMVVEWVKKVHGLLFDYHAVYTTSKKSHDGKPPMDNARVETISRLAQSKVDPFIACFLVPFLFLLFLINIFYRNRKLI